MNEQEFKLDLPTVADMFRPPQDVRFVTVKDSLKTASTVMRMHNFSQLLVVKQTPTKSKDKCGVHYDQVVGCFSWESFAQAAIQLGSGFSLETQIEPFVDKKGSEKFVCVKYTEPVIDVALKLQNHEYVIAVDERDFVKAFVTPYDISKLYLELVKPYSELQKIELILKKIVEKISPEKKKACLLECRQDDSEEIVRRFDSNCFTFGDYKVLLEHEWNPDISLDKAYFFKCFREIIGLRNDAMHFNRALKDSEIALISGFGKILRDYIDFFVK